MKEIMKLIRRVSLAVLAGIGTLQLNAHADEGFVIKGIMKNVSDQTITLMENFPRSKTSNQLATGKIVDGKFQLEGTLANPPAIVQLVFAEEGYWAPHFFIENSEINISLEGAPSPRNPEQVQVSFVEVTGSKAQSASNELDQILEVQFYSKREPIFEEFAELQARNEGKLAQDWPEADRQRMDELNELNQTMVVALDDYLKSVARDKPDELIALMALYRLYFGMPSFKEDSERQALFAGLTEELRTSQFGVIYDQMARDLAIQQVEQKAAAARVSVGAPFIDFSQKDVDGNLVQAKDLLKPGRYLFLDFWASWCGPCRAENPNVLKAYNNYHDKGFDVLAVSLDTDKDSWLDAIEEDGMPWIHLSNLEGWESAIAKEYGVNGIPMNFLLDENGTIVAKGLREQKLHDKLEELLGE